jgi:NADPH:quinone reductase-like Zn-dependent oxidoreductase
MSNVEMHAAVLREQGAVPRYETFQVPRPSGDNIVGTVLAAALKPSDRLMAEGAHYASSVYPCVAGIDGIARLDNGDLVAFFMPKPPFGAMAEKTLLRPRALIQLDESTDPVAAAALLNPGMAAWKTVAWEGRLAEGQTILVLGATGTSGRIATQIAVGRGARVVIAGRDQAILDDLVSRGAQAAVRLDQPIDKVVALLADAGPFDVVADYVWGQPAEAAITALARPDAGRRQNPEPIRYILVGMSAGRKANLDAIALRRAPVQIVGSGVGAPPPDMATAQAAFDGLLRQYAAGGLAIDIEAVPLSGVEEAWSRTKGHSRLVFIP